MGDQFSDADANAFLMSGGVPSAKFENVGDQVMGFIMRTPEVQQQRDFDSGQPKFWDNDPTKPMMQVKVVLMTEERDPSDPEDSGERAIYVAANKQKAIAQAVREVGAKGLEVGGKLLLKYSGDGKASKPGRRAPKLYTAQYRPPAVSVDNLGASPEPVAAGAAGKNSTPAPF